MRHCALKNNLMFFLNKNLNSLGPKTLINMYSMPLHSYSMALWGKNHKKCLKCAHAP